MNIFVRIVNNLRYAYHAKQRDKAIIEMKKHVNDRSSSEFKRWGLMACYHLKKCIEINIH